MATFVLGVSLAFGQSFEAFRLKSGMTPEQVAKEYPTYEFRWAERSGPDWRQSRTPQP